MGLFTSHDTTTSLNSSSYIYTKIDLPKLANHGGINNLEKNMKEDETNMRYTDATDTTTRKNKKTINNNIIHALNINWRNPKTIPNPQFWNPKTINWRINGLTLHYLMTKGERKSELLEEVIPASWCLVEEVSEPRCLGFRRFSAGVKKKCELERSMNHCILSSE